ncbi:nucleotidyltransferase substrate binding protein [Hyphomicrobium sp. GJ21]|uniref:nucleotidyltransferase substrate binding protein n=1 Tax=Hyphomicrobium sp. GJ21 TaxID=113574 RepID=UPI00048B364A|nr:nucleotidyltransferase substrate binding protein [Hyphomicrobium sp. GJ21]
MERAAEALEAELRRLELRLWLLSSIGPMVFMGVPAYRAWAVKAFETSFEHAAALMEAALQERGFPKPCRGNEPFRLLVGRAKRAGMVGNAGEWRRYRDWRNVSVHHYSDDVARRVLNEVGAFIDSARALLVAVSNFG